MNTNILIPKGTKYLDEVISELPKNALFNKGKPGCGGTTIALADTKDYIIAIPTIHLAESKAESTAHCKIKAFAFTGKTTKKQLEGYLVSTKIKKILVTYDSLPKLITFTGYEGYHLLVDEYHLLFTQYNFRETAINGVLDHYKSFDSFTFMTATPLSDDFILEELKDVDLVTAEWAEQKPVLVQSVKCLDVASTVINIVQAFLNAEVVGNAYFFINSVKMINKIIEHLNLSDENTRVICSPNNETEISIQKSSPSSTPKKLNFLTSTCFEGVDLFDKQGKTFVISDNKQQHTLIDISTSLPQIAGRIRDSIYSDKITHLFSYTKDKFVSYEAYRKSLLTQQKNSKVIIDHINSLPTEAKVVLPSIDLQHVSKNQNGDFFLNNNSIKQELHSYRLKNYLYNNQQNITDETRLYGFNVQEFESLADTDIGFKNLPKAKEQFDATLKEIIDYLDTPKYKTAIYSTYRYSAFLKYTWLEGAIAKIGFQAIRDCNYKKSEIDKQMIICSDEDIYNKLVKLLAKEKKISQGKFVSSVYLKEVISASYKSLSLKFTGTASDINMFFDAKETTRKENYKSVKGYMLLSKRIVSNFPVFS